MSPEEATKLVGDWSTWLRGDADGAGLVQPSEKPEGDLTASLAAVSYREAGAGLFLKVHRERQEAIETSCNTGNPESA